MLQAVTAARRILLESLFLGQHEVEQVAHIVLVAGRKDGGCMRGAAVMDVVLGAEETLSLGLDWRRRRRLGRGLARDIMFDQMLRELALEHVAVSFGLEQAVQEQVRAMRETAKRSGVQQCVGLSLAGYNDDATAGCRLPPRARPPRLDASATSTSQRPRQTCR